ncbi:MAG: Sir2 silent information regulator family NAD-dependent deacetylase [Firmicutes bacterium]|nr:Sir2 silent information regulator family NAD-dependent deacetylase [Bacillota bacterium]
MEDMYTSSFYPFKTEEERWAYWAEHISLNRYDTPATQLYLDLFKLAKRKTYFVITTNVDHQFYKAGFPVEKIFAVQGDYGFFQCAKGCHSKLYYNEDIVKDMLAQTVECKIPMKLVPHCPVCGGLMDVNLRKDNYFVEDEAWYAASNRYTAFVRETTDKQVVYLELGVGFNTPGIIRLPFEQMIYQNPNAILIRINSHQPHGAKENSSKTISFSEDMTKVLAAL